MKKLVVFLMVLGLFVGGSGLASAALLVDRGLPTANLNGMNTDNLNRSNVAWNDGLGWVAGDDFTIGGTANYFVDKITVWTATSATTLPTWSVWFGPKNGTFTKFTASSQLTTYADALHSQYQTTSGPYINLYQLDISLNGGMVLSGSDTYEFYLDGTAPAWIHASNASLSGSPQEGADGKWHGAFVAGGGLTSFETWDSGVDLANGAGSSRMWDKSSDANVQVYGNSVPEPATMLLLGLGLIGLAGVRRKLKK